MSEKNYSEEWVKYIFPTDEKKEIAAELAQKVIELQHVEDEKKAIMSQFKSRIDQTQAAVNGAASKLSSGYEMRNIECEITSDYENKVFNYHRTDTNELVRQKKMSQDDLQKKLY